MLLVITLCLLLPTALAQTRTDLKGIVPGDELGWEIQELEASIVVTEATILNVQIFSPGFDPNDYRSALKGKQEMGDERYDKGKGQILSQFAMLHDNKVLQLEVYGVEPHRWVTFFRSPVQPGIYLLKSRLVGNGKNAFRYRLQTSVEGAAELLVEPTLQLYDMRQVVPKGSKTPSPRGKVFDEPFVLEVSPEVLPFKVGFYDEDGPREMLGRVRFGNGMVQNRQVSDDRKWAYYEVVKAGVVRFGFSQAPTSKQYSNTIGFRVEGCLQVRKEGFLVVPPRPVKVEVVDTAGQAVKAKTRTVGDRTRTVSLLEIPEGYRFQEVQIEGGEEKDPRTFEFGCAGGHALFVLEGPPKPPEPPKMPVPTPEPKAQPAPKPQPAPEAKLPPQPKLQPGPESIPHLIPITPAVPETRYQPQPLPITPEPARVVPPQPQPEPEKRLRPTPWVQPVFETRPVVPQPALQTGVPPGPLPEPEPEPKPEPDPPEPIPERPPAQPEFKPQPSLLELAAVLVLPEGEQPFDLALLVGEKAVQLSDGQARVELPGGIFPLQARLEGARIEGPQGVKLEVGEKVRVEFKVYPQVRIELSADKEQVYVGQEVTLTLKALTDFPELLPAALMLQLPDCLEPLASPRLTSPIRKGRVITLTLKTKAKCAGTVGVQGTLQPWNLQAQQAIRIIQPATFTLSKEALREAVPVGQEARYRLTIKNTGEEAGEVRVVDVLPNGLRGQSLDRTETIAAGAEQAIVVSGLITSDAPQEIKNTARLLQGEQELAKAEASVKVLRAKAELSRSLNYRMVVPGETVTVTIKVRNAGQADLNYQLSDIYPEWLEPITSPEWSGELPAGGEQIYSYKAKVRFGGEAEAGFVAQLTSNGGNPIAEDRLKRLPIEVSKTVDPERILIGGAAAFTIKLTNPTDHELSLEVVEAPDPALGAKLPEDLHITLPAGGTKEIVVPVKPTKTGELENQVGVLIDGIPASAPVKRTLAVLPILEPVRLSTLHLDFEVEEQKGLIADRLLLTHVPPEGSRYEPGSARLNGKPIPDPKVDEKGRLYFEVPFENKGVLSYTLRHRDSLGPIEPPTLTVGIGEREVRVQGDMGFEAFAKARVLEVKNREGMIKDPLPGTVFKVDKTKLTIEAQYGLELSVKLNGENISNKNLGQGSYDSVKGTQRLEYYGLPLKVGRNLIEVGSTAGSDRVEVFLIGPPAQLEVRPRKLQADGRSPLELELLVLDADGLPSGFGPLGVQANVEMLEPDAFPNESGYQVLVRDGRVIPRLQPVSTPTTLKLKLGFGELSAEREFYVLGKQGSIWLAQSSLGVRLGESVQVFGLARGYIETPLGDGILRGAVDGSLRFNQGQPELNNGLDDPPDPTRRFPVPGSATESQLPLRSDDPIAVRYDEQNFSVGYYADKLTLPGISDLPSSTVLRLESRGELGLQGFVGFLPLSSKVAQIIPDGTRFYRLGEAVQPGSEQVVVWVGAEEIRLERLRDYALDYPSGNIILARALFPTDPNFQPVRLQITYAPEGNARELGYGLGLRYKNSGFSVGAGAARVPGSDWRYGVEAGYEGGGLNLRTAYLHNQKGRYVLEMAYKGSELNANANFALEERIQGQARVAYNLSSQDQVSLEHQAAAQNRTGLLYQRRLDEHFSVGGGLGYTWEESALNVLARIGYQEGPLKTELTHSQPFSVLSKAQTQLKASYAVDANLSVEADLTNVWGNDLLGTVGLKQQFGAANLSVAYQLPNASGEGNRARFGLEAPIPLTERLSLGLSAGYERSLSTGRDQSAFGVALRYNNKELNATIGTEAAFSTQTKLVFRAGATGVLDSEQTLSFDATYQLLPAAEGQFTIAYALRAREVQLLTYHRLNSSSKGSFEGALAFTYQPDTRFQLRPSLAYRVPLLDAVGTTFQLGLGANYYLTDRLGFGGAMYYQFQPGTATGALGFSLEGSFKIMDELWFNLGYTFGGFTGITPDTYPGLYLRLDFLSGGDGR